MVYQKEIDGLRGLAVLLVFLHHAFPKGFANGAIGVDVFFIISGFLITGLITESIDHGIFDFKKFYYRRAQRILPLAFLIILVIVGLRYLFFGVIGVKLLVHNAAAAAGFYINFLIAHAESDSTAPIKDLWHYWTLAVEGQFYLVWPLLIYGIHLLGRKRVRTFFYIVFTAASFFIFVKTTKKIEFYHLTQTRLWELGLGAIASQFAGAINKQSIKLVFTTQLVCVLSLAGALAVHDIKLRIILGALAGFTAVLTVGVGVLKNFFGLRTLSYLGKISYSIYLWHSPLLILYSTNRPDFSTSERIIVSLVTLGLSGFTYKYVEKPFLRKC